MTRNDRDGDDRYVEFQVDGKQVLIVLAGILVLCVISFYFGRRVGRAEAAGDAGGISPMAEAIAGSESMDAEDAGADLTFFDAVEEEPQAASPPPVVSGEEEPKASAPAAAEPPRPARRETPGGTESTAATAPSTGPEAARATAGGFEIQVAVLSERTSAETLAQGLRAKGYEARVTTTRSQGQIRYRVRVGSYPDKAAAQAAAARIEEEEKLKTWIPPQGG
jgi:cell division septation protein DedD